MYGPNPEYFDRFTKRTLDAAAWAALRLPRHALHAAAIAFVHPGTRQKVRYESPLPKDLQTFVDGAA
jgi:23S rRNA pseudouridine1911/1915/1917 synthase